MNKSQNLLRLNLASTNLLQRLTCLLLVGFLFVLTGCSLPRLSAEDRLFLGLSVDFLGAYTAPVQDANQEPLGELAAIAYDRQRDRFYAITDQCGQTTQPCLYTLKLSLTADEVPQIASVVVEQVMGIPAFLEEGQGDRILPQGLAISPRHTLFISGEFHSDHQVTPFIREFDLAAPAWRKPLPLPQRLVSQPDSEIEQGIQPEQGLVALTLNPNSSFTYTQEPFRLFTTTSASLIQDQIQANVAEDSRQPQERLRLLHYLIGEDLPTLLDEHVYLLGLAEETNESPRLAELLTLDQGGHFLSLERSAAREGWSGHLFQLASGSATDITGVTSLQGDLTGIEPIRKRSLFKLQTQLPQSTPLGKLTGMTLGPRLPDKTQSLLLVSNNTASAPPTVQFLMLRLN